MKNLLSGFLLAVSISSFSQTAEKIIKEDDVARIIKTLSSDAMMGRPSAKPERMEPAMAFIESEFKKIGLKPLKGLSGFRQEFEKQQIRLDQAMVTIDGDVIPQEELVIVSEKTDIKFTTGLPVDVIAYDSTVTNKDRYFFQKAFLHVRDTSSSTLVLVAPEFKDSFRQLKGYFGQRFISGKKQTKIFVLGKTSAANFSIEAHQKIQTIKMANIAGVLEGKSQPEEMVVFSAHYDHLGILPPVNGDSIANGADDDASGTTAVIELAHYFKKMNNNNRTLVFVAFAAEEIGGFGSKYFSVQLDAAKVIAMFNIEMIGKPSKWGQNFAFITGYERSDFGTILSKNLEGTPFEFKPDPYPEQDLFYRSDNATLARLGVPAHSISTDQIDSDKLYHSVDDEFESMDIKNIAATIRAIALSARTIVAGTDTPKRIDVTTIR
jgi:hypothetical protein